VVDFKAIEGGDNPEINQDIDWTDLCLQVQLYARAAQAVLGENARTGYVHLLKDNQRVTVPISEEAVQAAVANVEWAVQGILSGDYPMRPHPEKCSQCDFCVLCRRIPQEFRSTELPPPIHLLNCQERVAAFSSYVPGG
jgi:DNA helicase-2/ATP-dependent DNA helicase PcrA